jgi:hypothetical protein
MLSFASHRDVKIFSKGAGSNPQLWGVMVSMNKNILNFYFVGYTYNILKFKLTPSEDASVLEIRRRLERMGTGTGTYLAVPKILPFSLKI